MAKKRTNPRRIPIAKREIDVDALLNEDSMQDVSWRAFLLVAPTLMDEGESIEGVRRIWDETIAFLRTPEAGTKVLGRAVLEMQKMLDIHPPYSNPNTRYVHSRADLDTLRRKLQRNSIHTALCILCVALERVRQMSPEQLRKLYVNAMLTEAEIGAGVSSYEAIERESHLRVAN